MPYQERSNRSRTTIWMSLISILLILGLALAACGDDAASEPTPEPEPTPTPTATPEPEPTPEPAEDAVFSPYLLFTNQHEDESGNVKVASVAFAPDGETVAAGYFIRALIFTVPDGDVVGDIELTHSADDLEFSPDGDLLAAALSVGGVRVIDVAGEGEALGLGSGFDNRIAFSPDGETVATGNRDGVVWIWNVADGEPVAEFEPPGNEWLIALAYTPDGAVVASGHWDGNVYLWDAADGTLLQTLENPYSYGYASQLAFSPDGALLAVAGAQEEFQQVVRIWNVEDGTEHAVLQFESDTRTVAFSPDGDLLAVGTAEGISLWNTADLTLVENLPFTVTPGESNWITDLEFSPDSTMLIAGQWGGVLELWQVQE
jgi:WD40 repeat protein